MNKEFVNKALNYLKDQVPIDLVWNFPLDNLERGQRITTRVPDGRINLIVGNKTFHYWFEVKNQIRNINLPVFYDLKRDFKNLVVIAQFIFPNIRKNLRQENINYIDLAGNVFLRIGENIIYIEGKKNDEIEKPRATDRAFNKTGLAIIFHLLNQEDFLNRTFREIAEIFGIALGNVTYILKNLEELGYVRKIENQNYKLLNKEALLQKWIQHYPTKLKPFLHLGDFKPWGLNIRDWKNLDLEQNTTLWGGEPAANLLTKYLIPAELTIYTAKNRQELITLMKLMPDPDGFIKVYKKFWIFDWEDKRTVPPILIYADLLNTGDPRNIETAQKIYERYIKEQL